MVVEAVEVCTSPGSVGTKVVCTSGGSALVGQQVGGVVACSVTAVARSSTRLSYERGQVWLRAGAEPAGRRSGRRNG